MSRVFPRGDDDKVQSPSSTSPPPAESMIFPSTFTVWKKSSMSFDCMDGFTVFDSRGRLAFRVDNYSRSCRWLTQDLVLMDGEGSPIMALRPKITSMHEQWDGFEGEGSPRKTGRGRRVFSIRKRHMANHKGQAVVNIGDDFSVPDFYIEGNYSKRCCKIRRVTGEVVAEICRKQASTSDAVLLGTDVFSLTINPGFDSELVMAFVVAMDRISWKYFIPALFH
ncbi:protein LURP-one-related 5-like [Nymphaea colorata]|nr:protein LURP-one-related 5-like [Nymphaea colorata]